MCPLLVSEVTGQGHGCSAALGALLMSTRLGQEPPNSDVLSGDCGLDSARRGRGEKQSERPAAQNGVAGVSTARTEVPEPQNPRVPISALPSFLGPRPGAAGFCTRPLRGGGRGTRVVMMRSCRHLAVISTLLRGISKGQRCGEARRNGPNPSSEVPLPPALAAGPGPSCAAGSLCRAGRPQRANTHQGSHRLEPPR